MLSVLEKYVGSGESDGEEEEEEEEEEKGEEDDDSEMEESKEKKKKKKKKKRRTPMYKVGEEIQARWLGGEERYNGRIVNNKNSDRWNRIVYDILYDDDGYEEIDVIEKYVEKRREKLSVVGGVVDGEGEGGGGDEGGSHGGMGGGMGVGRGGMGGGEGQHAGMVLALLQADIVEKEVVHKSDAPFPSDSSDEE